MTALRALAGPAVRLSREVPIWPRILTRSRGRGPLAVFLPAYGRHGAALLRIYNIAEALRAQGWQSVVLPAALTLAQRRRLLSAMRPEVVVMQGARHPLNRPDLYPEYPVVYDMDDADFHLPHLAGPVAQAMPGVAAVIAGSRYIADWCRDRGARAEVIWTASPVSRRPRVAHAQRPAVVAWAQTAPATHVAEADWVLEIMARLFRRRPDVRLRLYDRTPGDDPAFPDRFREAGIRTEWRASARYSDYLASFDDVSVGLAPLCLRTPFGHGKSFGKVLAYLDRKVPVIASDACEHGRFFDDACGVVSNAPDVWVDRIEWLLSRPDARQSMADTAYRRYQARLSLNEAARRTDRLLRNVCRVHGNEHNLHYRSEKSLA